MGFLSRLGGHIARGIGKIVEKAGVITGIKALENAGQKMQSAGDRMINGTAKRTGEIGSYDRDSATVEETVNVNDILSSFSMGLKGQCSALENSAKQQVENYFNTIINAMEQALGNTSGAHNLRTHKQLALTTINGALSNHLASRVSLSDNECMQILRMSRGEEKENQMRQFGEKVIREGLDALCDTLGIVLAGLQSDIDEELKELAAAQKKELESTIDQLRQIVEKRQDDVEDSESALLAPAKKLAASEVALEVIRGGLT